MTFDCSSVAADIVVEGLTIQNGIVEGEHGAGLYAITTGDLVINNTIVRYNSCGLQGGVIYINGAANLMLNNNKIENNIGIQGGGIVIWYVVSAIMRDNYIDSNLSSGVQSGFGGGLRLERCGNTTLEDNLISRNNSNENGGGVFIRQGGKVSLLYNTIIDNTAENSAGAAISGIEIILKKNNLINNSATNFIGGISISGDSPDSLVTLVDNMIRYNNSVIWGGGVRLSGIKIVNLINNIISANSTNGDGAGLNIDPAANAKISLINNTITMNTTNGSGGGVYLNFPIDSEEAFIHSNIVFNNTAELGADFYLENGSNGISSSISLNNNDFLQSSPEGIYMAVPFPIPESNLDNIDPQFDTDGYHLTAGSPCIDAGMDAGIYVDIDGDPRPQGNGFDIGADEYVRLFIPINIDIKPDSPDNSVNINDHGVIPVAILGSADFDVTQVDPTTITLQGMIVKIVGKSNKHLSDYTDVNGDGYIDLLLKIEDSDGNFVEGQTEATLTGFLYDGPPIEGTDTIRIVP